MLLQSVDIEFINKLQEIVGEKYIITDEAGLLPYAADKTKGAFHMPDVVVKPFDTEGVSKIVKLCNEYSIPLTTQGGRSGQSGAAVPINGGVALSMERFDKILKIDKANYQVIVEPGVITEHLQNILKEQGLFYPPDPAGRGWSFIGGNVATNAGGPRCVKYGVTRDYVMNLEVVLPNGEIIWTGANTLKFSTGYNLTHLMIGSEGTLGIITQIVLKLLPHPQYNLLLLVPFTDVESACNAVNAIFQKGIIPSALEMMERDAVIETAAYVGQMPLELKDNHEAHLLIEVDGNNMAKLQEDCEEIATILQNFTQEEILYADNEAQKNDLWRLRRNCGNALITRFNGKLSEDTVVPRSELPALLRGVKQIGKKYGLDTISLGHIGDGNIHVNLLNREDGSEAWHKEARKAKMEVYHLVKSLGGMLSAEHGVGYIQRPYMSIFFSEIHFEILRGIKKVFDPKGFLNPNKVIP